MYFCGMEYSITRVDMDYTPMRIAKSKSEYRINNREIIAATVDLDAMEVPGTPIIMVQNCVLDNLRLRDQYYNAGFLKDPGYVMTEKGFHKIITAQFEENRKTAFLIRYYGTIEEVVPMASA